MEDKNAKYQGLTIVANGRIEKSEVPSLVRILSTLNSTTQKKMKAELLTLMQGLGFGKTPCGDYTIIRDGMEVTEEDHAFYSEIINIMTAKSRISFTNEYGDEWRLTPRGEEVKGYLETPACPCCKFGGFNAYTLEDPEDIENSILRFTCKKCFSTWDSEIVKSPPMNITDNNKSYTLRRKDLLDIIQKVENGSLDSVVNELNNLIEEN